MRMSERHKMLAGEPYHASHPELVDEQAPAANETGTENPVQVMDEAPVENFATPEPTPTPAPSPTPIVEDDRPSDEQVQDDADAVGMTARLPREDTGNATAPVD